MMYQPPEGNDPLHPAGQPVGPNYPSQPPIYQPGYPQQPGYPPPPTGPSQPLYSAPPQPGYPPPPMQPMAYGPQRAARTGQGDSMAVAGMILGVISLAVYMVGPCGFIFSVLGIIFSLAGRQSLRNQTWATAGLVLSSIGLAITILHGFGFTIPGLP